MSDKPNLPEKTRKMLAEGSVKSVDVFASLRETHPVGAKSKPAVFVVPQISEEQRDAVSRITEVYGSVVPEASRRLTDEELVLIAEERDTIDKVLKFLSERKDKSIRETLAHHLDAVSREESEDPDSLPLDTKGHVAVKHFVMAGGRKVERTVSQGKPSLTLAAVEAAYQAGTIDKDTYMSITTQTRVLDETKAVAAMKKDPALAYTLFGLTTSPDPTTSITVKKA